jgi:exopolyphosphatase / guanosine-5'-triphosphate,3'-diphosphate pyrophosphatase
MTSFAIGDGRRPVKVAALDVGSNSFHLVVVEAAADGTVRVLARAKQMVRLGEASLREGVIPPAACERGLRALQLLAEVARQHQPDAVVAVATSAVREASNGLVFLEAARRRCGLAIRTIDGTEEARLIYLGARQALALKGRQAALFDVGGGSTEAILGNDHQALLSSSLEIGVLRLRENWQRSDPASPHDIEFMAEWVRTVMRPTVLRFRAAGFDLVALTSGSALALARLAGRRIPPLAGVDRHHLPLESLRVWERRLAAMSAEERGRVPGLDPARVDTIVPGAVILRTIVELTGATQAVVCDAALREGMIADYLLGPEARAPLPGGQTPGNVRVKSAPASSQTLGSVKVKAAPLPSSLSTDTAPPMASTRCLTMERPSPVPPTSRERPESTR